LVYTACISGLFCAFINSTPENTEKTANQAVFLIKIKIRSNSKMGTPEILQISTEEIDMIDEQPSAEAIETTRKILKVYGSRGPEQIRSDLVGNIVVIEPEKIAESTYLAH
jgi:hypothetical protein